MYKSFLSLMSTLLITAMIFGCSGGGSSSSTPAASATPSSGTISDPYIYNALFNEIPAGGGESLQATKAPSDKKGNFTFPAPLTVGSTITMVSVTGVEHATPDGTTTKYEGPILTRRVSQELINAVATGKKVIVTPLTTYADQLQTVAEDKGEELSESEAVAKIVELINTASGGELVTAGNLFKDPMAAFETGGDNDPSLLQASMAINIALETTDEEFDATFEAALELVQIILPKNDDGSAPSEDQFVAANIIIEVVAKSTTPEDVAKDIDKTDVEAIVTAVETLGNNEVVVVSDDGTPEVKLAFTNTDLPGMYNLFGLDGSTIIFASDGSFIQANPLTPTNFEIGQWRINEAGSLIQEQIEGKAADYSRTITLTNVDPQQDPAGGETGQLNYVCTYTGSENQQDTLILQTRLPISFSAESIIGNTYTLVYETGTITFTSATEGILVSPDETSFTWEITADGALSYTHPNGEITTFYLFSSAATQLVGFEYFTVSNRIDDALFETLELLESPTDTEPTDVPAGGTGDLTAEQIAFNTSYTAAVEALNSQTITSTSELITIANNFSSVKAATTSSSITASQEQLDTINFFNAFSRVMLLTNPLTDNDSTNGLQRLSDILDALDIPTDEALRAENFGLETCVEVTDEFGTHLECESNIFPYNANGIAIVPDTTPTTGDLQEFLYDRVGAELITAIATLNTVSQDFNLATNIDGEETEFDSSDVLFSKSIANAALFEIDLQQGLVIDADIKVIASRDGGTVADVLSDHPDLLATKDATYLASAKGYAIAAVTDMKMAIVAMQAESDGQKNDFINVYEEDATEQEEQEENIDEAIADLNKALALLNGSTGFTTSEGQNYAVDLTQFFAGNIDLNSLLPAFNGNTPEMFPSATLDGILSADIGLNDDLYQDGIPDIIQDELVKFTETMLTSQSFFTMGQDVPFSVITFNNDYSFTMEDGELGEQGHWTLSDDGLTITLIYDDDGATTIITFDGGWLEENGVDLSAFWTEDGVNTEAYIVTATPLTGFTTEMLNWRTIQRSFFGSQFSMTLEDSGHYGGNFNTTTTEDVVIGSETVYLGTDKVVIAVEPLTDGTFLIHLDDGSSVTSVDPDLDIEFRDIAAQQDVFNSYKVSGAWSVDPSGDLILTPDADCEALIAKDENINTVRFEVANGYVTDWGYISFLKLTRTNLDINGDILPITLLNGSPADNFTAPYNLW